MPKPRKNEIVRCVHYTWRLVCRDNVWYADGRSNSPSAGRHSLETKDRTFALQLLAELDLKIAQDRGLVPRSAAIAMPSTQLSLAEGRRLYEDHLKRPRVTGGVKPSTRKRYKAALDKFMAFAQTQGILNWDIVDGDSLIRFATFMENCEYKKKSYKYKTIKHDLTTIKQLVRWLIAAKHLVGKEPIVLPLRKAESERPYCWKAEEVTAIINYCRQHSELHWLGNALSALACTGLRISELAALRWADINLPLGKIILTDETAHGNAHGIGQRELKSGRSRSFPIHQDLAEVFAKIAHKDAFVFHGPRGGRLKPDTVRNVLVSKVLSVLASNFPSTDEAKGFVHGRLHSFRHYFCSFCANSNVPEHMLMEWLGHQDSEMVRHYYHLSDKESQRRMKGLDLLGNTDKPAAG